MYNESDAEFDRLQAEAERIDAIVDEEYDSRMVDLEKLAMTVSNNADILNVELYGDSAIELTEVSIISHSYLVARMILKHDKVLETIKRCVRNECEQDLNL